MNEGFVQVAGARLRYVEMGHGAPVVVLHGGPDFDHRYLRPELDALADSFHVVYYDQRGRGGSSGEAADVTIESECDDLDRLCTHFGFEAPALLGHSWGALLAMEFATRHPDRAGSLVLMNAAPASRAAVDSFRARRQSVEPETLAGMRSIGSTGAYACGDIAAEADYFRLHFGSTFRSREHLESLLRRLRAGATAADVLRAREIEEHLHDGTWNRAGYDLAPKLARLRLPTLVLHAEHDTIPVDFVKPIAEVIPGAQMVVLPGCGHFAYIERPREVAAAIERFLVDSGAASPQPR